MKKLLISLLLGVLAFEAAAQKTVCNVYTRTGDTGKNTVWWHYNKKQTKSKPIRGYCKVRFGESYLVWRFKKGIPKPGAINSYYADGTPHSVMEYNDRGEPDGMFVYYYPGGGLKSRTDWRDGTPDGEQTEWYANGQKSFSGLTAQGVRTGTGTAWRTDGQLLSEWNYAEGLKNGRCITWVYDNDGALNGKSVFYYKMDVPVDSSLYYVYGPEGRERLQSVTHYDGQGQVSCTEVFQNDSETRMEFEHGELKSMKQYRDGALVSSIAYRDGVSHGDAVIYYPGGEKICRIERYSNGELIGSAEYDPEGRGVLYKKADDEGALRRCSEAEYEDWIRKIDG